MTPPSTGLYRFSIAGGGSAQLYVANRIVVSLMRADFGMVAHGTIQLTAGHPVPIELKFSNDANHLGQYLRLGWAPPEPDLLREAVDAARRADVAVVFASELEGEGYDKLALGLPGDQDRLIEAVADANPRTIVVLHTSNPVAMPWLNRVSAIIEAWYPGQEAGSSIGAVLFGDVNPSGKLPMTFPADESQGPATNWTEYPGDGYTANFTEGVLVGYRWLPANVSARFCDMQLFTNRCCEPEQGRRPEHADKPSRAKKCGRCTSVAVARWLARPLTVVAKTCPVSQRLSVLMPLSLTSQVPPSLVV